MRDASIQNEWPKLARPASSGRRGNNHVVFATGNICEHAVVICRLGDKRTEGTYLRSTDKSMRVLVPRVVG